MLTILPPNTSKFKAWILPYVTLAPICVGVFIAADDQTVIVTVLPQIIVDMGILPTELNRASWTITGYMLGYVAMMPLMGKLGDVWGHKRLYIVSISIFMLGSMAVALAPSLVWLVAARVLQAVGAGALVPIAIAIARDLFPEKHSGVALGFIGASAEAGGVIGPLWGGLISNFLDWRWVFWINIPLGIIVILTLLRLVPVSPKHPGKVDYVGGLLIAIALTTMTLALSRIDKLDFITLSFMATSLAIIAILITHQGLISSPLIPTSMFRSKLMRGATITHLLVGAAMITGMVTIPLVANTVMSLTPLEGGLWLMRMTIAMPLGAILGGLACQRFGYRLPTMAGLLLSALGFYLMSGWNIHIADPNLTTHLSICGFGFGLLIAPIALAATDSVREEHRGTAAATVTATRVIGMTLGLAALTAWGTHRFQILAPANQWPFAMPGETAVDFQVRMTGYQASISEAGFTLFSEFFLIATAICLFATLPAISMGWRKS